MKNQYDVVIMGTGIAGLFTAVNIEGRRVLLISKTKMSSGSTPLAQGGIVSCRYRDIHFQDTVKAGSFYNKEEAVRAIEEDSSENIEKLIELGVNFERGIDGALKYTREGGHSENTILYSKDRTGREIVDKLIEAVVKREDIDVMEDSMVTEIQKKDNRVSGVKVIGKGGKPIFIETETLVVASGGIGELYLNTTNTPEATGDGIAIAYRAGASVKDMEFVQFHPTSFYLKAEKKRFLISESMRGEGAKLINEAGEKFMDRYHEMGELAPRDIVSRGIYREILAGRKVYLDIRHERREHLKDRFPTIYENCLKEGVDISSDLVEISPAEHYIMGGIETDLMGKTDIDGLYACGECACTGVHGGNRLASNSLLEGIVFGNRIARDINLSDKKRSRSTEIRSKYEIRDGEKPDFEYYREIRDRIKHIMEAKLGIVRERGKMTEALEELKALEKKLAKSTSETVEYNEVRNMITVSRLIAEAALNRRESLGAHYVERRDKIAEQIGCKEDNRGCTA